MTENKSKQEIAAKEARQAEQEQVSVLLGDQEPIEVECSNGVTYEITRPKCAVSVLASNHFKNTESVSEYSHKLQQIRDQIKALGDNEEAVKLRLKEFEVVQHDMISEYVAKIENSEEVCKGLAYVILNDKDAIYADSHIVMPPVLRFFGIKDVKRKDKNRLWRKLYDELDSNDIHQLFIAWTQKINGEVFFYTTGLIHNLNNLKVQSPPRQQ